jgi:hypothetical protein
MIDFSSVDRPITFADFEAGAEIGSQEFEIDNAMFELWTSLYPTDADCFPVMPPGMMAMVLMRGYMHAIPKRAPGNIHAEQQIDLVRLPKIGDTVMTTYRCVRKEERLGRKWIYLASKTTDEAGETLFLGRMTTIFAQ